MNRPQIDGFADWMATRGFDDKQALITLGAMWSQQIQALEPEAIIGFYAPILWLVGPARAPTFALGNGLTLPPVLGTSFPRLSVESTPIADEELMLANANAVLARLGQPALATLSEVIGVCTAILYGLPTLDPYLRFRRSLTTGLLGQQPTPTPPPAEQRLAVFLDIYCPGIEMIVLALAGLDRILVDICVSGITTSMRRFLEQQPHITVYSEYATLLEHAANAGALVHHGVQDVTQRCISLGRPQLLIPWRKEHEILNYMVGWMEFTWAKPPTVSIGEMATTLRDLLRQESLTVAAQHHARELANTDCVDALPGIVERIEMSARNSVVPIHSPIGDHPLQPLPTKSHRMLRTK
jgi:hypothetical protein